MRKPLLSLVAVAATLMLAACSGGGGDSPSADANSGASGGTLTLGTTVAPGSWNLLEAQAGAAYQQYLQPVYDSLVHLNIQGDPTASLATEWTWDDTNTVLTLTLRTDVTFTDGAVLDAAAVKANLESTKSGAGEVAGALAGVTAIDVIDPQTVQITLAAPDPSFLPRLGMAPGMIASPASLTDGSAATAPVGSGPYVLATEGTTEGSVYTFTRNPDYWDTATYPYDTVVLKVLTDQTARENAVRTGEVDAAEAAPTNADSLDAAG
ncbi:MAG: peptide ABC transporter substrate-binding protein, partial [Cellulomonadaceae bacterium]|nr:peptide ABC transporter substrate-binding protein [Cellulomonadaceae bacterium]